MTDDNRAKAWGEHERRLQHFHREGSPAWHDCRRTFFAGWNTALEWTHGGAVATHLRHLESGSPDIDADCVWCESWMRSLEVASGLRHE